MISCPEVVHAGTPTSLAITVLADFPGRVTAEVAHGNTKVVQTEDFRGGDTAETRRLWVILHNHLTFCAKVAVVFSFKV